LAKDRNRMNEPTASLVARRLWIGACASILAAGGCAAPLMTSYLSGSRRQEADAEATAEVDPAAAENDPKARALRKALGQQPATEDEALAGVLDELEEIGAIDQTAQQELLSDLKVAKPEHYSLIVEQFQAALAYRRQLAEREKREQLQLATDGTPSSHAEAAAAHQSSRVVSRRMSAAPTSSMVESDLPASEMPTAFVSHAEPRLQPALVTTASATATGERDGALKHATANVASSSPSSWQRQLAAAIDELQRNVRPQPATVAELHDHLRLRALLLIAGRAEEAYQPVPGASPAQQDYWSKQLFAMGAYLDGSQALDDKQRAAGALVHLDEARAALTQLATLQIRNLAFVASVDGYGAYEPIKHAEFEPGAPISIYAEVENFTSASTERGYETSLGTSYQIIDATGRRLAGEMFPDVVDVCRGRRRDFHLQYGVRLPLQMAAGEYRLELTMTDQRSGKIGQATLPFEITGVPIGTTPSKPR
jgi:hypothetical protein